jgi:hypothetical protein
MTDRFNPSDIIVAHLKGLRNRRYDRARPLGVADRTARVLLYVLPLAGAAAMIIWDGVLAGPDGLLAAAGVLTGAFFMGFSQVAGWRERFTERRNAREASEVHQRDSLDEVIAHLLMAIYATAALLVDVVVGLNLADDKGNLTGIPAAIAVAIGMYIILLLLVILPKLYTAYAGINQLDDEVSGLSR